MVTTGNNMYLIFRAKAKLKTEVFLEIQAGLTKGFDLNVTDTVVDDNAGRGIWVSHSVFGQTWSELREMAMSIPSNYEEFVKIMIS